jgi:hypothetical protein
MISIQITTMVGGWSALSTSLMLKVGTVFGVYQLRTSAKVRRLQVLSSTYQQLRP